MRNLVEQLIKAQATRLDDADTISLHAAGALDQKAFKAELQTITLEDVLQTSLADIAVPEVVKRPIGFHTNWNQERAATVPAPN